MSGLSSRIFLQSFNLLRLIKLNMIKTTFPPFLDSLRGTRFLVTPLLFVCVVKKNKKKVI